jgi:hypothetical protein
MVPLAQRDLLVILVIMALLALAVLLVTLALLDKLDIRALPVPMEQLVQRVLLVLPAHRVMQALKATLDQLAHVVLPVLLVS